MQHVHYDLSKMEAGIRDMFANAPADAIHDDPAVVEPFRRAVDVEVAFSTWFVNEVMRGTQPDQMLEAMSCLFVNLIMNRIMSFSPDGGSAGDLLSDFMDDVFNGVAGAFNHRQENGHSTHVVEVSPVTSGRA